VPETAAEIAVPLPFNTPVIDVEIVIAGVVVAFATVPANPFADVTETVETVPEAPVEDASNVTTPLLFFAYSFMSAVFSANSPLTKFPASGTAEAVVL
jgi:hypothetical protein